MSTSPSHPVQTGLVNATPIIPNLLSNGAGTNPWDIKKVALSANYVRTHPAGFPPMPPAGGEAKKVVNPTGTLASGQTFSFFASEAAALVAASAGTYA